jgi:alpha-D-ribose 1-methylphosphonate 5-triphosphate synthase subunit PhnI
MAYVAAKGGEKAISNSKKFFYNFIKEENLIFLIDKIIGEGALYSEQLAKKAIEKSGGDPLIASFYLRAQRTTYKRAGKAEPISLLNFRVIRRISSAFKEIPKGQILGPTNDYIIKILNGDVDLSEDNDNILEISYNVTDNYNIPSAVDIIREMNLILPVSFKEKETFDITRKTPEPPYPRSASMQIMARGETGGMLLLAYTSMRGYGDIHPTVGDLRTGYVSVFFKHPLTNKKVKIGEIRATSCEIIGSTKVNEKMFFTVGYGFCLGFNETKAISMAILDNAMTYSSYTVGEQGIASNKEMVLMHIDSIESLGFCNHYKLPHYVTFNADINVVKGSRSKK